MTIRAKGKALLESTVLTITQGRRYGLVGPNGKGKSTLLRMIARRQIPVPDSLDVLLVEQVRRHWTCEPVRLLGATCFLLYSQNTSCYVITAAQNAWSSHHLQTSCLYHPMRGNPLPQLERLLGHLSISTLRQLDGILGQSYLSNTVGADRA